MNNLSEYFDSNQSFLCRKYLADTYGFVSDVAGIVDNCDNKDLEATTDDLLKELIPNITKIVRIIYKHNTVNEKDKLKLSSSVLFAFVDKAVYVFKSDELSVYGDPSFCDTEKLHEIWKKLPDQKKDSKESVVNLVGYTTGTYYLLESKIKALEMDIDTHYNDDFIPIYKDIENFIESRDSGLVLLFGGCGTGKTSLIRHLCYTHPKEYIIVPTSLTNKLGDPDFVSFMIDNSNSIFILEDCEQVLMDRNVNMFNGAISNILNMSDGLLSDILNLKFICTFNADISAIDQALLRKGRCFAKYEFDKLSENKVKILNDKYNLGITDIKPMTLAEIYHKDKTEYVSPKRNKIGF